MIDDRLGSFMMELSALPCHVLLAVTLLTLSEAHQNAFSLTSCLNQVWSRKIKCYFFPISRSVSSNKILLGINVCVKRVSEISPSLYTIDCNTELNIEQCRRDFVSILTSGMVDLSLHFLCMMFVYRSVNA